MELHNAVITRSTEGAEAEYAKVDSAITQAEVAKVFSKLLSAKAPGG